MVTGTKKTKAFYNTEIPEDWKVNTLGDCCLVKGEYGINAPAVEYSESLPAYIRITDIDDSGNYTKNKKASVSDSNYEQFILKTGDIVFARTGATVGKTYLYNPSDGILVFAGFLIRFRTNEKLLTSQHLKYFTETKHYWDWVKTVSMRSGQPGINAEEYASLKIPLPPLPEQKAIAQVLNTADAAILTTERLLAQKELRKKWLMQQLLTGKKRLKGFGGEWKEVKLGKMIEICSSKRVLEEDWKTIGIPFYRTREIIKLSNDEELKSPIFITDSLFEELKSKYGVPKTNDILVTGVGTIGETYIVKAKDKFYFKDGNVIWFKMNEKINSSFLNQLFKTVYIRKQLMNNASITTVATFTIEGAKNTTIKLPAIEEQAAIAQILQAADKEISLLKAKTEKLREQKKGLIQVLLTGKKRLRI